MINWLTKIAANITEIDNALEYYETEYVNYMKVFAIKGEKIIEVNSRLPGWTGSVIARISEINSINAYFDTVIGEESQRVRALTQKSHNRSYTAKQLEELVDNDPNVLALRRIGIQINAMSEKWEGISKGLNQMSYLMKTISDFRKDGLDDMTI